MLFFFCVGKTNEIYHSSCNDEIFLIEHFITSAVTLPFVMHYFMNSFYVVYESFEIYNNQIFSKIYSYGVHRDCSDNNKSLF